MLLKMKSYYKEFGAKKFLRRCLQPARRLGRILWQRKKYYVFYHQVSRSSLPPLYDDIRFKQVDEAMIDTIAAQLVDHYGQNAARTICNQIKAGDFAIVGLDPVNEKDIMCICWISSRDELLLAFLGEKPSLQGSCDRRLYVPEKYRRKGIAARVYQYRNWIAKMNDIKILWAFVEKENRAAYKLHTLRLKSDFYGTLCVGSFIGIKYARVHRRPGDNI